MKKVHDNQMVLVKSNISPYHIALKALLMLLSFFTYTNSYGQSQTPQSSSVELSTENISVIKISLPPYQETKYPEQESFNKLIQVTQEFWSLWGRENQQKIKFIPLPMSENSAALQQQKIDIAALNYQDNTLNNIAFSIPFASYKQRLFRRKNSSKEYISVGIFDHNQQSLNHLDHFMEREYYNNADELLANYNKFDVLYSIEPWVLEEKINALKLTNKFYLNHDSGVNIYLKAAVRANDKNLLSTINESFRNVNIIKPLQWQRKLITTINKKSPISLMIGGYLTTLSEQEKEFILNNNEVFYSLIKEGFPPFIIPPNSVDINVYGFVIDIYNQITQKTGIVFKPYYIPNLLQAIDAVGQNKKILIPLLEYTKKRNKIYDYSIPYIDNQYSLIYRKTQLPSPSIKNLNNELIAAIRGFNSTKRLRSLFPNATFKFYNNSTEALAAVSYGEANVFITNSLFGRYFIKKAGFFNLASQQLPDFSQNTKIHFAALKGNSELISILDSVLKTISTKEFKALSDRWKHETIFIEHKIQNIDDIYRYGLYLITLLILLSSILYFLYYQQLKKREKAKLKLVETLKITEAARIEAEKSSQAKVSFLAQMSHEIRTPMNGILGMAEAISFTNLDRNQHDLLNTLRNSATDLLALLNDVLDFSKMDAGELNLESIPVDISALSHRIVKSFEHHQSAEKLKLALHIDDKINTAYFSDPTRLIQVLNNLFSNAVKFTEKGVIELSIMLIDSTSTDTETVDTLRFSVRDTGIGIPSSKHSSLFTPFVQADSDTTRKFGGTGLGLSISQEIITSMGGKISLSSSPNLGSLFYFSLKLKQSKPIEASKERRNSPRLIAHENDDRFKDFRVLIVEDNLVNIKVLSAQLARLHVKADVAKNGQEALVMHNSLPYDIIFSDCHMPIMDGFELAERINQNKTSRPIWLIAVTADALSGSAENCIRAGFDDYMAKPTPQEIVANKLNNAYRQILHKKDLASGLSSEIQQYKIFQPQILLMINHQDKETAKQTLTLFSDNWQTEKIQIISALEQQDYHKLAVYVEQLKSNLKELCDDKMDNYIKLITLYAQENNSLETTTTVQYFIQQLDILTHEIKHWLKNS